VAFQYSGNTKQKGLVHANVVCALKVNPGGSPPAEYLDSTTADANGDFTLTWFDWDGRVVIGAFDEDETEKLQCRFIDFLTGTNTNTRYAGWLEFSPVFFYELSETGASWANTLDAAATVETAATFTVPLSTRQWLEDYLGLPAMVVDQDCLLTEVTAGKTDGYNFAGELSVGAIVKTGNDIATLQTICGWGDEGSLIAAGNTQWSLNIESSKFTFRHQYSDGILVNHVSTQTLVENTEYCILVTRDVTASNTVSFYINGVLAGAVTQSSSVRPTGGSSGKFAIAGAYGSASQCFDGTISSLYGGELVLTASQAMKMYRRAETYFQSLMLGFDEIRFYWPMRETSGTISKDIALKGGSATNGYYGINNRSINNHEAQPGGMGGMATTFRANGQGTRYINSWLDIPIQDSFTFGGWFRAATPEYAYARLFAYYRSSSNYFQLRQGNINYTQHFGGVANGTTIPTAVGKDSVHETWEFLSCTINLYTGLVSIYRNGQLSWTYTASPPVYPDNSYDLGVGGNDWGGSNFKGYICGCFHISRELRPSEIMELYQAAIFTGRDVEMANQMLSQWTMDDIVSTTIADELLTNDGTINGTVPAITDGRFGDAIGLPGVSTDYVDCGQLFATGLAAMTLTFWFRHTTGATAGYLMAKYDADNNARCFFVYYDGTSYQFGVMSSASAYSASQVATSHATPVLDDGLWHHCACRFDENTVIEINVDNTDWKQAGNPSTMADTAEPFLIGKCGSTSPEPLDIDIDDLKIFDSALTDDEISQAFVRQ